MASGRDSGKLRYPRVACIEALDVILTGRGRGFLSYHELCHMASTASTTSMLAREMTGKRRAILAAWNSSVIFRAGDYDKG